MTYHHNALGIDFTRAMTGPGVSSGGVATTAPQRTAGTISSPSRSIAINIASTAIRVSPTTPGRAIADAVSKGGLSTGQKSLANFVVQELASTKSADVITNAMSSLDVAILTKILNWLRLAALTAPPPPAQVFTASKFIAPKATLAVITQPKPSEWTSSPPPAPEPYLPGGDIAPTTEWTASPPPTIVETAEADGILPAGTATAAESIFSKVPKWVWIGSGVAVVGGGVAWWMSRKKTVKANRRRRRRHR